MGYSGKAGRLTALLLVGFVGSAPAMASPWGQEARKSLLISKIDIYKAEAGDRHFEQLTSDDYGELGLGRGWTIGGQVIAGQQEIDTPGYADVRDGLVDATLFLQREIPAEEGHALAVQALYAFATDATSVIDGRVHEGRDPAIEVSGLWGYGDEETFLTAKTGARASLGDDADELRLTLSAGRHLTPRSMVMLDLATTLSVTEAEDEGGTDYDLITLSPSLVVPLGKWCRLQVGGRADLWGDGLDTGAGAFIGLWFE